MKHISLTGDAERLLKTAFFDGGYEDIKAEVNAGEASAHKIGNIALILRPENTELVIVAAAGKGILEVAPTIYRYAKQQGFESMRFHTLRASIDSMVAAFPFALIEARPTPSGTEYIYRLML